MALYKVTIGDEYSCFEFSVNHKNINRLFSSEDAAIIHELISCMIPNCGSVEQRVNGLDYYVEKINVCKSPRSELDLLL